MQILFSYATNQYNSVWIIEIKKWQIVISLSLFSFKLVDAVKLLKYYIFKTCLAVIGTRLCDSEECKSDSVPPHFSYISATPTVAKLSPEQ
jgi:hypothetical protein